MKYKGVWSWSKETPSPHCKVSLTVFLKLSMHVIPKFTNKIPLKPVQSPSVLNQFQIDLVDMSSSPSSTGTSFWLYSTSVGFVHFSQRALLRWPLDWLEFSNDIKEEVVLSSMMGFFNLNHHTIIPTYLPLCPWVIWPAVDDFNSQCFHY